MLGAQSLHGSFLTSVALIGLQKIFIFSFNPVRNLLISDIIIIYDKDSINIV